MARNTDIGLSPSRFIVALFEKLDGWSSCGQHRVVLRGRHRRPRGCVAPLRRPVRTAPRRAGRLTRVTPVRWRASDLSLRRLVRRLPRRGRDAYRPPHPGGRLPGHAANRRAAARPGHSRPPGTDYLRDTRDPTRTAPTRETTRWVMVHTEHTVRHRPVDRARPYNCGHSRASQRRDLAAVPVLDAPPVTTVIAWPPHSRLRAVADLIRVATRL